jgi:hypothetical protein
MGIAAGIGSVAGGLLGLLEGSPASNVPAPQGFNMPNMGGAAGNAYAGIGNLPGGQANQFLPYATGGTWGAINNPYVNTASGMGIQNAFNQYGLGNVVGGYGEALLPYSQNLMQTGFDPQGALYARTLQQVQDQTRAGNEAAGVATTPYGAGIEAQGVNNFNIDWQNQQLQRELQAAQGAGGLLHAGAGGITTGLGLSGSAPGQLTASALLPYSTGLQDIISLYGILGGAQGLGQVPIQDYLSYLGGGTNQQNAQTGLYNAQVGATNTAFNQSQAYGKMLGGGLGAFSPTPYNQNPWSNSMIGSWLGGGGGGSSYSTSV